MPATIEHLPNEILEYIISLLPPYEDIRNCRAVSRKWNEIARHIIPRTLRNFRDRLDSHNITWRIVWANDVNITPRYAHSACRYRDSMYVFGGFTESFSSFNDLWELNLSTRKWRRLSVNGKCPTPKAGATMVSFRNKLILFGGMLPAMCGTLHHDFYFQTRRMSDHVHTFHVQSNTWEEVSMGENNAVPGLAGHTATVHGEKMVVFGGLDQRKCVNDIYVFDFIKKKWSSVSVAGEKPMARFGHSQVYVDDHHLLILGGVVSNDSTLLDDTWLLNMSSDFWHWSRIDLGMQSSIIKSVWCHSVCRVGKFIVIFKPTTVNANMYSDWLSPFTKYPLKCTNSNIPEVNLNGQRGLLGRIPRAGGERKLQSHSSWSRLQSPNMFQKCRSSCDPFHRNVINSSDAGSSFELHVLDLSSVVSDRRLVYLRSSKCKPLHCSSETILYTVIEGNGELVLFGGIQKDAPDLRNNNEEFVPKISNAIQIITLKNRII